MTTLTVVSAHFEKKKKTFLCTSVFTMCAAALQLYYFSEKVTHSFTSRVWITKSCLVTGHTLAADLTPQSAVDR